MSLRAAVTGSRNTPSLSDCHRTYQKGTADFKLNLMTSFFSINFLPREKELEV